MTAVTEQITQEAESFVPMEGAEWTARDDSWRKTRRLEILAWELVRYEPELAGSLAEAGKRRWQVG